MELDTPSVNGSTMQHGAQDGQPRPKMPKMATFKPWPSWQELAIFGGDVEMRRR
jgi:hypothetical protein